MGVRRWSGPIVLEGVQTGDGRYINPGILKWPALPVPLALLPEEQHGDLLRGGVTVGNIDAITRNESGQVIGEGVIDDEVPEGAAAIRRMDAGTAPFGSSWGVSIDPDNWSVDVIDAGAEPLDGGGPVDAGESSKVITLSGVGARGIADFRGGNDWRAQLVRGVQAAAGDPLPETGEILWTDRADSIIGRFTRLRVRGATMCAIPAFDGARIALAAASASGGADDGGEATDDPAADEQPVPEPVAGGARVLTAPAPPLDWFRDPGFEGPCRVTIDSELVGGQLRTYGHIALRESCHTGYTDRCVRPPMGGDYIEFSQGRVIAAEGHEVFTGKLAWGIPHADLTLGMIEAFAHYADSTKGWADVAVGEDQWGIWFAGATMPKLDAADVYVLRTLPQSGDWRWSHREKRLKMIASLSVNYAGFPITAGAEVITASGAQLSMADDDQPLALVAAGMVDCPPDEVRDLDYALRAIDRLQRTTAPLRKVRVDAALARMRASE